LPSLIKLSKLELVLNIRLDKFLQLFNTGT